MPFFVFSEGGRSFVFLAGHKRAVYPELDGRFGIKIRVLEQYYCFLISVVLKMKISSTEIPMLVLLALGEIASLLRNKLFCL